MPGRQTGAQYMKKIELTGRDGRTFFYQIGEVLASSELTENEKYVTVINMAVVGFGSQIAKDLGYTPLHDGNPMEWEVRGVSQTDSSKILAKIAKS